MYRSSRRRSVGKPGFRPRRRRRNYAPLVVLVLGILVLWGGIRFFQVLFSPGSGDVASAVLQIHKGVTEFSLRETETWTRAYSDQEFLKGDTIRTMPNSRISLSILGGNTVFLSGDSVLRIEKLEQKSPERKNIFLSLEQGELWGTVTEDDFSEERRSRFVVQTPRMEMHIRGTIFDITSTATEDTVRLLKGSADIAVLNAEGDTIETLEIGVGQKLVLNDVTRQKVLAGEDVLEMVDNSFQESEWHLQNLENFAPQEVAQIRRKIEVTASRNQPDLAVDTSLAAPEILSPEPEAHFPSTTETVTIEGTAPQEAFQIIVNGYTLTKFRPGDRKWTYFASRKFGTLLPGENIYSVIAVSRDGKRSDESTVRIFYEGTDIPPKATAPAEPAPDLDATIDSFSAPVILDPVLPDPTKPYATGDPVLVISGLVDPKTNAVEVNDYRLQKFEPGDTEFEYTANAQYGNMSAGENTYRIVAFGPDGKTAKTEIQVLYTPTQ